VEAERTAESRRPIFASTLRGYRSAWLSRDTLAGLTVWAVLVPESLAYATIAGVTPVAGLYAAFPALVLYAVLGGSRSLITGPMAATAALSASTVAALGFSDADAFLDLSIALAIGVGVVAIVAALLRLGFVANFISEPVLKGFVIGLALTVIVGQIPQILGIEKGSGDFFEQLTDLVRSLGEAQLWPSIVGLSAIGLLLALRRWAPRAPGSLIAVIAGIAAVSAFDLATKGVATVGAIPSGLPSIGVPDLTLDQVLDLAPSCVAVMIVGFAEALGAARADPGGGRLDPNQELLGLGGANVSSGLFGGFVVNGSLSKTAVNQAAGARSQLSGLVAAALVVLTLLFLTGLFEDLPEPVLGAVVVVALVELVDVRSLRRLFGIHGTELRGVLGSAARPDFLAAVAAMVGVLVFDTLPGLFIGIALSFLLLIFRVSSPPVTPLGRVPGTDQFTALERHPANEVPAGVVILRVESGLLFANAQHVRAAIEASLSGDTRAVVVDGETTPYIDVSGAAMLRELRDRLAERGIRLLWARELGSVHEELAQDDDDDPIEIFPTVADALAAVEPPRA
jgi:sulfate permease, SulP family